MKVAFIVLLVFNLLVEMLASASLILGPDGISAAGAGEMWSMHYGFAALAIASIGLWVWPHRSSLAAVTTVLGILSTFHTGLTISLALAGDQMAGMITHTILAASSLLLLTQREKICATTTKDAEYD